MEESRIGITLIKRRYSKSLFPHYIVLLHPYIYLLSSFGDVLRWSKFWANCNLFWASAKFLCTCPKCALFHCLSFTPHLSTIRDTPSIDSLFLPSFQTCLIILVHPSSPTHISSNLNGFGPYLLVGVHFVSSYIGE